MSIDQKAVEKLAKLSMLTFKDDEVKKVGGKLSDILDFVSQLQQVDTDGIEALTGVSHMADMQTPEREDKVTQTNNRDALLENAPAEEMGFFVVPRVVE